MSSGLFRAAWMLMHVTTAKHSVAAIEESQHHIMEASPTIRW